MIRGSRAPRGVCPACGKTVAGRMADGKLVIRAHKAGPRAAWSCPGSHSGVPAVEPGA